MRNTLFTLAFLCLAASYSQMAPATPLITLELIPSTPKIHPPETFYVDVEISGLHTGGLTALLGNFNFDLNFDPQLTVFFTDSTNFTDPQECPGGACFGTHLGSIESGEAIGYHDSSNAGLIQIAETSLLDASELEGLQLSDEFRLATFGFIAGPELGSLMPFGITNLILGDPFGQPIMDDSGQLVPIVTQPVSVLVSEPSSLNLGLIALAALVLVRRNTRLNKS